jgi:hypothetical protein
MKDIGFVLTSYLTAASEAREKEDALSVSVYTKNLERRKE